MRIQNWYIAIAMLNIVARLCCTNRLKAGVPLFPGRLVP